MLRSASNSGSDVNALLEQLNPYCVPMLTLTLHRSQQAAILLQRRGFRRGHAAGAAELPRVPGQWWPQGLSPRLQLGARKTLWVSLAFGAAARGSRPPLLWWRAVGAAWSQKPSFKLPSQPDLPAMVTTVASGIAQKADETRDARSQSNAVLVC